MGLNLTGLQRLIRTKTAIGELPEIKEYTVTGNPATFSTNLIQPLQVCEIPFMPVQSGSGTPSPENVRPISGWPGVTVTANGKTILVAWESVAGVVYGGTVDLVTGVMTVTHTVKKISEISGWQLHNNTSARQAWKTFDVAIQTAAANQTVNCYSSIFASVSYSATWKPWNVSQAANDGTGILLCVPSAKYESVDAMIADIGDTTLCYVMSEPQTVRLAATEIKTIIGQNSIATNTAGTNTIKYLKRG